METSYSYFCPNCSQECSIVQSLTGQNVVCPHCSQEFFATAPENNAEVIIPEKLPFFKSARRKLLQERVQELVSDGEMSDNDSDVLEKTAILLGLNRSDLQGIVKKDFLREFAGIQNRMETAFVLTDRDLEDIEVLKTKYGIKELDLEGNASLFRQIYLLENKGQLPPPLLVNLMLDAGEVAHFAIASNWLQVRVRSEGYVGTSFSIPTGLKGVRFRFGRYEPVRREEITPLASGTLYATSKRLIFHGDRRNTKVDYKKVIDAEIYSDAVKVEKLTGKPDYFSMNAAQARFVTALIGAFKSA